MSLKIGFNKTLSFRIVVFLVVIGVIIFLPMTWLIVDSHRKNYVLSFTRMSNDLILGTILGTTRHSMLMNDRDAMEFTIKNMNRVPGIEYVRIYGKDKIAFSSDKEEVGRAFDKKHSLCLKCHQFDPVPAQIPEGEESHFFENEKGRHLVKAAPIMNSRVCATCHPSPSEQRVLGVLEVTLSLEDLDKEIARSRNMIVGMLVSAVLVMMAMAVLFIWYFVHRRVKALADGTDRVGGGDLAYRVDVRGEDELAALGESFNRMAASIESQKQDIERQSENIIAAVDLLTDTASHLMTITTQQTAGASEQATVVSEVVATSQEISSTADRIAETASAVRDYSGQTSEAAKSGSEIMVTTIRAMDQVREQMEKTMKQMSELSEKAQNIVSIIDIIEDISEQTNLLALNATLEAAGAGEAGARFSVVAGEVRRLANRTMETIESVRAMVESVQGAIQSMVMFSEAQQKSVEQGVESVRSMGEHFQHILQLVETTTQSGSEISKITKQQSNAIQQMASSMSQVADAAREVENGVKEIESSMEELNSMASRLQALTSEAEHAPERQ